MPTLFEEIDAAATGTKDSGGKSLFDEIDDAAKSSTPAPTERRIAGRTVRTPWEGAKAILSGFTPGAVKDSVFSASEPAAPVQDIVAQSEQSVKDAPPGSIEEKLALAGLFSGSLVAPLTAPAGVLGFGSSALASGVAKSAPSLLPLARGTAASINAAMAAPMADTAGALAGEASVEPTAANIGALLGTTAMAILGGAGVAAELFRKAPPVFKPGAGAAINNLKAVEAAKADAAKLLKAEAAERAFQAEAKTNDMRAADFLKAKAELHAQAAADLEAAMTQNQIGTGESTVLAGTPEQNRLNILDTKPGEALRERARLTKPPLAVDEGGIPPTAALSRQAQDVAALEGEAFSTPPQRPRSKTPLAAPAEPPPVEPVAPVVPPLMEKPPVKAASEGVPPSSDTGGETPKGQAAETVPEAIPSSNRKIADQRRNIKDMERQAKKLDERAPDKAAELRTRINSEREMLAQLVANKKDGARPTVGVDPKGDPDILTDIAEHVGTLRTAGDSESKARLRVLEGVARRLRGGEEGAEWTDAIETLNNIGSRTMAERGQYNFRSPAELEDAISNALASRDRARSSLKVEQYSQGVESKFIAANEEDGARLLASGKGRLIEEIGVGGKFKIDGEKFSIVGVEETADGLFEYVIKDGHLFRVPEGSVVMPDKGRVTGAKPLSKQKDVDFLPEGEEPPTPVSERPAAPLALESATLEQQAAEATTARERLLVQKQRDEIAARSDKPLVGDSSDVGQGTLLAGDEDMFSGPSAETLAKKRSGEAGFVDPRLLLSAPVQSGIQGTAGALYGATQGNTPEERRANMLKFGTAGLLTGVGTGFAGKALMGRAAATTKYRDYVKELAQGTEGMPAWYLKARTIEPIVKFREQFVGTGGSATRIKDVLAENPADVPDALNPYLGRRLFPGKVSSRIELDVEKPMDAVITNRDTAAIEWAKRTGGSREDFNRYFQEYAVAKTAKDYNFHNADYDPTKPASGMTDVQADTIVADAVANGTAPVFEDLRRQLRVIDETYLDILRDGELITQADVDRLRAKYPEHIPLQRVLEDMNPDDAMGSVYSAPKFGMKSAGIKGAYGSDLPIADVFDSVLANVKDAMIRAERNKQGVVTANYFEQYPTPGVTVRLAPVEGTRADGSPIFVKPDNNTTLITKRLAPTGNINEVHVEFDDPLLAKAFNGLNVEKTQPLLRIVSKLTNALGSLYTAGSLDFKLPNKLRDLQEAATTIATSGDTKAAAQIPLRALQDMKAVSDFIREKPTPGAAAYEAMKREGGFVGGLASSTREAADKSVKHMGLTGPLTRTADAVTAFYKFLDQVAEDSTRLSAGRTADAVGATPMESALASREAGVDFNLSGSGTKQLGAFYKFINPSIMGTTRAAKALVRNPGTIGAAATAFMGSGLIIDSWNKTFDPDWKKHRAMQWYRTSSMPLIIGEDADSYLVFTPPVAQMLRPVKGLVDIGIDAIEGELESGQEAASRARKVVNDSMNPFGGSSLRQSVTPTLADPFSDIVANESYSGAKIFPEQGPQDPMFSKVFDRTLTTTSGQLAIDGARVLHRMGFEVSPEALTYLVKGYGGGPLQTASQGLTLAKGATGSSGDITPRDIPVLGRFIHQVPKDSPITRGPEQRALGEVRDIAGEEKMALRRRTLQAIEGFKTKNADEIAVELTRLKKDDPDLIKAMTSELLSSTRDSIDKQLLQMNPVSRARFIDGQMQKMNPDEQIDYVNRLSTGPQPIITKAVRQELAALIEQQMAAPAGKN